MTDAMEAVRQGVQQEAPDELVGRKRDDLRLAVMAIILPAEADPAFGKTDQAAVGDGDAMGIAAEISRWVVFPHINGTDKKVRESAADSRTPSASGLTPATSGPGLS